MIGAGDICILSSLSRAKATAALVAARPNDIVFTLGDNSNEAGTTAQYANCVAQAWGAPGIKPRTHPVPGNHDYGTAGAAPYFAFYGVPPYYSYDPAPGWHAIALNSQLSVTGAQETWLKADLAANAGKHIIAYWHQPEFSSGGAHGNSTAFRAWWNDLYAAHACIVMNGHDHDYERFAPQTPAGVAAADGIREFVVGTGGAGDRAMGTIRANSQVRNATAYGALELTLTPTGYAWDFISTTGAAVDAGSAGCPA